MYKNNFTFAEWQEIEALVDIAEHFVDEITVVDETDAEFKQWLEERIRLSKAMLFDQENFNRTQKAKRLAEMEADLLIEAAAQANQRPTMIQRLKVAAVKVEAKCSHPNT